MEPSPQPAGPYPAAKTETGSKNREAATAIRPNRPIILSLEKTIAANPDRRSDDSSIVSKHLKFNQSTKSRKNKQFLLDEVEFTEALLGCQMNI
jgi:hypothetical protein